MQSNNAVHYFFDPVCSWCFGFSAHMSEFYARHRNELRFEVYTGGMVQDASSEAGRQKAPYIREVLQRIQDLTGATFGRKYLQRLEQGTSIYSSEVPSKMFHALSAHMPGRKPEIASAIQELIYLDGIDPFDESAYVPLAEKFGLPVSSVKTAIGSGEIERRYEEDRYTTRQFGVQSFPFTLVELDGEYYLLAKGFAPIDILDKTLQAAVAYHARKH